MFPRDWRAVALGLLMKELTWEERVVAAESEVITICKLTMMLPEDTLRIVTWSALTPKVDTMKAMKASSKITVLLGLDEYQVKSVSEKFTANLEVSAWVADLKAYFITKATAGDHQLATALTFLGYEAKAFMKTTNPANFGALITAMEEKFAAKATPWDNLQALLRLEYASPMQANIEAFYKLAEKVELAELVLAACFASKIESSAIRKALTEKKPATLAEAVECVRQSLPQAASSSSRGSRSPQCVLVRDGHSEVFDYSGEAVRQRYNANPEDIIYVANGIHRGQSLPPPELVTMLLQIFHPTIQPQTVHLNYVHDVLVTSDHFNNLFAAYEA